MGRAKAHREQGQAGGLARWAGSSGSRRGLLPLSLSVHRTCPPVELWALNKFFCSEELTTPLLPGRLREPEPALSISMAGVVLRQLKI